MGREFHPSVNAIEFSKEKYWKYLIYTDIDTCLDDVVIHDGYFVNFSINPDGSGILIIQLTYGTLYLVVRFLEVIAFEIDDLNNSDFYIHESEIITEDELYAYLCKLPKKLIIGQNNIEKMISGLYYRTNIYQSGYIEIIHHKAIQYFVYETE